MKFAVHPTEFVVHLPHKESAARLMIIDPANAALRDKVGPCHVRCQDSQQIRLPTYLCSSERPTAVLSQSST